MTMETPSFNLLDEPWIRVTMHEALMVCEGDEEGRIAEVYQKGYMMDGRVLRYAKVRVTKRKGPAPEPAKGMAGVGISENDKEND